jgi:hypothetical protein
MSGVTEENNDNLSSGRDSNPATPKYKSRTLPLHQLAQSKSAKDAIKRRNHGFECHRLPHTHDWLWACNDGQLRPKTLYIPHDACRVRRAAYQVGADEWKRINVTPVLKSRYSHLHISDQQRSTGYLESNDTRFIIISLDYIMSYVRLHDLIGVRAKI